MFNAEKENKAKSFDEINNDAKKVKNEAVSSIKADPEGALNQAKDKAREAGKNVSEFLNRNTRKLKDAEENASRTISSNPLTSAAAIFAAGLVLGSAFKRSNRKNRA